MNNEATRAFQHSLGSQKELLIDISGDGLTLRSDNVQAPIPMVTLIRPQRFII